MTSANFTEAAHERNIEAGILVVDSVIALQIANQKRTISLATSDKW